MLTVSLILAILALLLAVGSAVERVGVPLWVSVVLLSILALLHSLPLGR